MAHRSPVALAAVLALALSPATALADDCPSGSRMKSEDGFSWCEPSVCNGDADCQPSEVCRAVPLCVQVGKLGEQDGTKDAAQRLVATQRCAPDETCPSTTTCSNMKRCVSRAEADKTDPSPAAPAAEAKKSSCGCHAVGAPGETRAALGVAIAALAAVGSRRIHRRARRSPAKR